MSIVRVHVEYDPARGEYQISGADNDSGRKTVIEGFVNSQRGAGLDDGKIQKKETYSIEIFWDQRRDTFEARDDVGNKNERNRILMGALSRL